MKENLIYIYNMVQAEFILHEVLADGLYRIGKASKGDCCVSFFDIPKVKNAINKWDNQTK